MVMGILSTSAWAGEPVGLVQEQPSEVLLKARAGYQRALGLVSAGKHERALAAFEAVLVPLAREPKSSDLFYNLVQVGRALKRWDKVLLYGQGFVARDSLESRWGLRGAGESPDARAMRSIIEFARGRIVPAPVELTPAAPEGATVYVDDTPMPATRSMWLTVGVHHVEVTLAEHEPWRKDVTLAAGAAVTLEVVLQKLVRMGRLEVKTTPKEGVQVFVDDKLTGTTPLAPLELLAKRCLVRFEKPGYDSWSRYVTIEATGATVVSPVLEKTPTPAPTPPEPPRKAPK